MKKLLSILTAVCILICICPFGMSAYADEEVTYVRYEWTGSALEKKIVSVGSDQIVPMTSAVTEMENGMFYVCDGTGTIADRIKVKENSTANIILKDGCDMTFTLGIEVSDGTALNIYGQENGTGILKAATAEKNAWSCDSNAAIGSNGQTKPGVEYPHGKSGTINIHGGVINAVGGASGSGIGGGHEDSNGTVNIYGGSVTAGSKLKGSAIGSGYCGGHYDNDRGEINGGNVNIYGGAVTAEGGHFGYDEPGYWADGIGGGLISSGGWWCDGAAVTICGGLVKASRISNAPTNQKGESVYGVNIPNNGADVTIDGTTYNVANRSEVSAYFPVGKKIIFIGDDRYRVTVNGEDDYTVEQVVCDSSHSLNTNKVDCLGGICSECGKFFYGDHTPADPVIENETEAVCEKGGSYDEVIYCSVCSKEISRETIETEAPGHIEDEGTETDEGTVYRCKVCKEILRTVPKQEDKPNDDKPNEDKPKDNASRREETPSGNTPNNNPSYTIPSVPSAPSAPSYKPAVFVPAPEIKTDITIENGKAKLEWNKIDGASEYIIYEVNNGKLTEVKRTKELTAELKYRSGTTYIVKYVKNGVISSTSKSKAEIKADKPVVSAEVGTDFVKFTWQDMSADKYIVYKYVNGKAVKIGEVTKTSVKITGLKPDTEYSYIISAVIDGEETVKLKRDVITVRTMKENAL